MEYQLTKYMSPASLPSWLPNGSIAIPESFPKIICLCGSTQYWDEFQDAAEAEILKGYIVLSVGIRFREGNSIYDRLDECERRYVKDDLDILHRRKIDLADEVLVVNVDGYIGDSTRGEIEYALEHGKPVRYQYPDLYPAVGGL